MTENEAICALRRGYSYSLKSQLEALKMAIKALEEVQEYRKIGTVEECREAVEKQNPMKPEFIHMLGYTKYKAKCMCGNFFTASIKIKENPKFCSECGVKFIWGEEE